jgi:hypothetical protein
VGFAASEISGAFIVVNDLFYFFPLVFFHKTPHRTFQIIMTQNGRENISSPTERLIDQHSVGVSK